MGEGGTGKSKGFADEHYRKLIQRLSSRRKELGLSQAKLAERLGNHQQSVGRFELGERRLDAIEFADVAAVLALDSGGLLNQIANER